MGRIIFSLIIVFSFGAFESAVASAVKNKSNSSDNSKTILSVKYFSQTMGNIHQNASRFSQVLTTISCNHPLKVLKLTSKDGKDLSSLGDSNWTFVSAGPYEGYVMSDFLSDKKNYCLEEEYSKFFDGLELDINDLYYWARLYDQYVQGKSKVQQ